MPSCPKCGKVLIEIGEETTEMYFEPEMINGVKHHHDDNTITTYFKCKACNTCYTTETTALCGHASCDWNIRPTPKLIQTNMIL